MVISKFIQNITLNIKGISTLDFFYEKKLLSMHLFCVLVQVETVICLFVTDAATFVYVNIYVRTFSKIDNVKMVSFILS